MPAIIRRQLLGKAARFEGARFPWEQKFTFSSFWNEEGCCTISRVIMKRSVFEEIENLFLSCFNLVPRSYVILEDFFIFSNSR